jgi:hypothetical protein
LHPNELLDQPLGLANPPPRKINSTLADIEIGAVEATERHSLYADDDRSHFGESAITATPLFSDL